MSEIQSAEKFASEVADDRKGTLCDKIAIIRARDRAIVERIRGRMENQLLYSDLDETDITLILDAVLRELGGEQ